jgi:hypothetical protein
MQQEIDKAANLRSEPQREAQLAHYGAEYPRCSVLLRATFVAGGATLLASFRPSRELLFSLTVVFQ